MSKPWIRADEAAFIAVGVPEDKREIFIRRALKVLEQAGYAAKEMEPDDIVEQAEHIITIRSAAAALAQSQTERQETDK